MDLGGAKKDVKVFAAEGFFLVPGGGRGGGEGWEVVSYIYIYIYLYSSSISINPTFPSFVVGGRRRAG